MSNIEVDIASNGLRVPLTHAAIKEIVRYVCAQERVKEAEISITFVSDGEISRLNREYLDHRGPTDIISFELKAMNGVPVGDIYIAPSVARLNARANGVRIRDELVRLVVHGTLHVLGYTHPEDENRVTSTMWVKQEKLVATLIKAIINA